MKLKNYTISQIATKKVITVTPEVTLLEAREILLRYKITIISLLN